MDFEKLCAKRYSLRKFSDAPVEKEKLEKIIEAGHNAPTAHNNQPQRIFVLQSKEALEKADACTPMHFHAPVMLVVAYDAEIAWKREFDGKNHGEIDAVTFTSASTVRGFVRAMGENEIDYGSVCAVCIGEQTARAAAEYGMQTETAAQASMDAMTEKIVELYGNCR